MVRDLVEYLVRHLVEDREAVHITTEPGQELILSVHVAAGEEGRVIGKNGRVIHAIRTLARAVADPRERVRVELIAPRNDQRDVETRETEEG